MIDQGVTAALAARDATRNGVDSHTSGMGVRGSERVARECTYQDSMKCKPLYFKGTKGVVELTQWFERMETIFRISNCSVENQIKFSTCTLLAGALTWWNSHVLTVTHDVAYAMTWVDLRKKMADKYCPRNEIKKLEAGLWNLKVIGTDVVRYVSGLPDMIHGNIVASKPKTMQEAVEMATELMDKRMALGNHKAEYLKVSMRNGLEMGCIVSMVLPEESRLYFRCLSFHDNRFSNKNIPYGDIIDGMQASLSHCDRHQWCLYTSRIAISYYMRDQDVLRSRLKWRRWKSIKACYITREDDSNQRRTRVYKAIRELSTGSLADGQVQNSRRTI
ncbi:hypothetical protein Tco_0145072 [Tanacetum coccineum]